MLVTGKTYVSQSGADSLEIKGITANTQQAGNQLFWVHFVTPKEPKGYHIYGSTQGPVAGRDSVFLQGQGFRRQVPNPAATDEIISVNLVGHVMKRDANDVPTSLFLQFTQLVDGSGHHEELHAPDGEVYTLTT